MEPEGAHDLRRAAADACDTLRARHEARERALPLCRRATRESALAVRAVHRGALDPAREHLAAARAALDEADTATVAHPAVREAGYLHDAQKEYAEANLTLAFVTDAPPPDAATLHVDVPAFLHGMVEAASELRRAVLDRLRAGDAAEAQVLFGVMEDAYDVAASVDYPDALTGGLRRATDALRAVLERTRGDITNAIVLARFDAALDARDRAAPR